MRIQYDAWDRVAAEAQSEQTNSAKIYRIISPPLNYGPSDALALVESMAHRTKSSWGVSRVYYLPISELN